ncbi:polysaccharide biosynthesis protein [Aliigemmobacter aestuarii]|uniref:dTDP-4-dehydrorhamnose 3,5-epimerase n=1 Tax=Aliigemmobacter aestuarii TaxID=1445661 RepID=A0A4S3MQC4_9RHOB|nr:dTDP-4-dehydrorhamnose 3,5-epimerase family protein [Gemmobacter aestuarii]THD84648.1 polysaccharide biosynthesis protein [Gemmobacter aestuarii]
MVTLDDFTDDAPWVPATPAFADLAVENQIEGLRLRRLVSNSDGRGTLTVLMTDLHDPSFVTPHVYHVMAEAGSVRAWVYHKRQSDRLAFLAGSFRVVLYDLRPESPTRGALNVLDVGAANPVLLTIPAFVVHGVQNLGHEAAHFINMPTRAYDPAHPDKSRLDRDHPGIPYRFG